MESTSSLRMGAVGRHPALSPPQPQSIHLTQLASYWFYQ